MRTIKDILNNKGSIVYTTHIQATLADVSRQMAEHKIRAMPVTDDNQKVVGIISIVDIGDAVGKRPTEVSSLSVKDVMTTDVIFIADNADVEVAAKIMLDNKISHLPVLGKNLEDLVGIVSAGDVLKAAYEDVNNLAGHLENMVNSPR